MSRTPSKYSTPQSSKSHRQISTGVTKCPDSPSTPSQHYSVLKMISTITSNLIDSQYLTTPQRKSSLLLNKSLSTHSDDCFIEDRFIPNRRRLVSEFDMNQEEEEEGMGGDPQVMTVADIYSEEILGKTMAKQDN